MFLNDRTILKSGLFEGIKLASRQHGDSLALCRFGPTQNFSLVAIGQNLDKLLVFDLASLTRRLLNDKSGSSGEQSNADQNQQQQSVSYISIKDHVIETVAVVDGGHSTTGSFAAGNRDLLLIGCSNSIMIYDTFEREHLFSVQTSSRITTIAAALSSAHIDQLGNSASRLLFCGGIQKLYAYQLAYSNLSTSVSAPAQAGDSLINFELSNERTISETVSCLIHGRFGAFHCLVADL